MEKRIVVCFLSVLIFGFSKAQISGGGTPLSFNNKNLSHPLAEKIVKSPDLSMIKAEDEVNDLYTGPYRYGVNIPAGFTPENTGTWEILENGSKIWRLKITSKNAKALGLYYENFRLPPGGKLFLYNEDHTKVIGAFTDFNNHHTGLFATELIPGDNLILEYNEPADVTGTVSFTISEINYAYRGFSVSKGFGDSESCEVNVNCSPEGDDYQDVKRSVAKMSYKKDGSGNWYCTGSLMNNTDEDCYPYFLTAFHCVEECNENDFATMLFYFNWEAAGCSNPGTSPSAQTINGASLLAKGQFDGGSDFALLGLHSYIPSSYSPWFNGWDRSGSFSGGGAGIHHPEGDIKKISTYTSTPALVTASSMGNNSALEVYWVETANGDGMLEPGSSGSPVFDDDGYMLGTLTMGTHDCSTNPNYAYYGSMHYHWRLNGSSADKRLKPWLDPGSTGVTSLTGMNGTDNINPDVDFTASSTSVDAGNTITFYDASLAFPGSDYNWTFEGGTPSTSTLKNPTVTFNSGGTFNISLTVSRNGYSDTETKMDYIVVTGASGIAEPVEEDIIIAPNPAYDYLYIAFSENSGDKTMKIYDLTGKEQKTAILNRQSNIIDISDIPEGFYVLFIETASGLYKDKVIIQ